MPDIHPTIRAAYVSFCGTIYLHSFYSFTSIASTLSIFLGHYTISVSGLFQLILYPGRQQSISKLVEERWLSCQLTNAYFRHQGLITLSLFATFLLLRIYGCSCAVIIKAIYNVLWIYFAILLSHPRMVSYVNLLPDLHSLLYCLYPIGFPFLNDNKV